MEHILQLDKDVGVSPVEMGCPELISGSNSTTFS